MYMSLSFLNIHHPYFAQILTRTIGLAAPLKLIGAPYTHAMDIDNDRDGWTLLRLRANHFESRGHTNGQPPPSPLTFDLLTHTHADMRSKNNTIILIFLSPNDHIHTPHECITRLFPSAPRPGLVHVQWS